MIRIGAAAAPRWWGADPARRASYLGHLAKSGATSVELIVHHGPASRDPSSVHLDRSEWRDALSEAVALGLHVDVHNSLDPRFRLERRELDRAGFEADLEPILEFLAEIERRQGEPPVFVVHAAVGATEPERATADAVTWIADELARRGSSTAVCVESRAGLGVDDDRLDRDRRRLESFLEALGHPAVGLCWDVANDWATARWAGAAGFQIEPFPACLRHVHLHGATAEGLLHAPLTKGNVPWEEAIAALRAAAWEGSVTLEIRYRLANDVGEPWTVLAESVRRVSRVER